MANQICVVYYIGYELESFVVLDRQLMSNLIYKCNAASHLSSSLFRFRPNFRIPPPPLRCFPCFPLMGEISPETISPKEKRRSSLSLGIKWQHQRKTGTGKKKAIAALKINNGGGGGGSTAWCGDDEDEDEDEGELQISSPTLISRTTSRINPLPSPHLSVKERSVPIAIDKNQLSKKHLNNYHWDAAAADDNDAELEISSPTLIFRTTSHISPIPSPNFSRCSSSTRANEEEFDDGQEFFPFPSPKILSRTTSQNVPNNNKGSSSSRSRRKSSVENWKYDEYSDNDSDEFQISSPKLLSRTTSRMSPMASPHHNAATRTSLSGSAPSTPIFFSQSGVRRKQNVVEKKLDCTLEELCLGCVKKMSIRRDAISNSGLIVREDEVLPIKVKPGWRKGTKIIFEGKGDERPGMFPADIVFVIDEKMHPIFEREGDNLELEVEVPLFQALTGCTISVPLLVGGNMAVTIDDVIYPGYKMVVPGQGMPKYKEEGKRGDLKLKFMVEFPEELTKEQREQVVSILEECGSEP